MKAEAAAVRQKARRVEKRAMVEVYYFLVYYKKEQHEEIIMKKERAWSLEIGVDISTGIKEDTKDMTSLQPKRGEFITIYVIGRYYNLVLTSWGDTRTLLCW